MEHRQKELWLLFSFLDRPPKSLDKDIDARIQLLVMRQFQGAVEQGRGPARRIEGWRPASMGEIARADQVPSGNAKGCPTARPSC